MLLISVVKDTFSDRYKNQEYYRPLKKNIHFIGIGGIGVSALARYFLFKGNKISGSDFSRSELTDQLKKEGIKISIGHRANNISKNIDLVICSTAIKEDNIEIQRANRLSIPVKFYSEVLGELTRQYKTIAVSGAHGKSTTTAMLSLILIAAGLDPTVIIGTKLREFSGKNFRAGKGEWLVIEADEYHQAFLRYSPSAAIITNIDREHLDYYKNLSVIKKAFLKFIGNIKCGGILILNQDDKNLRDLKNKINKCAQKNNLKIFWYGKKSNKLPIKLNIPGEHNISNALAAANLAKILSSSHKLNINKKTILDALGKYNGAWRRMECRLKEPRPKGRGIAPWGGSGCSLTDMNGLRPFLKKCGRSSPRQAAGNSRPLPLKRGGREIYDDYAHHPTEIKATLAAFRQKYPKENNKNRLVCVFQPHQEKRLHFLFKEFTGAFDNIDDLILLDIFKVKGRDYSANLVVSENVIKNLAQIIRKRKYSPANVLYLSNQKKLKKEIENIYASADKNQYKSTIVVMMGAGDIYKMTDKLVK